MVAKTTVERNNGNSVNGEPIHNANNYNLPDAFTRSFDPYSDIHYKLENGHVFLVNTSTTNPLLKNLKISDKQTTQCTIMPGQTLMFKNAVNAMLSYVRVPHITGVVRQEPAQGNADKQPEQKIEREKRVILLDLTGQNDRPLPIKHNITLFVENTTQGSSAVRQLNDVIYNPFSRVFTTEKGDGLKVYAIPDSLLDVKKDLNENKNLSQSESAGLISALEETGQETRADGAILHHMKYEVPNNYIEIELLDEDDQPEAGAKFQILNETGKILFNSKLDDNGYAIVEGIDVSDATVFFPGVEESAIYDKAQGEKA
jgi:hypothetical protein